MTWTVQYFLHQAHVWEGHGIQAEDDNNSGAAAYAARKVAMWTQLATVSEKQFQSVNTLYQAVLTCNS
jgi:hypothetical protein